MWYWDDSTIVGPPAVVAAAVRFLAGLTLETGLELRWDKCHLHCVDEDAKKKIQDLELFNSDVQLHGHMNFEFLKVPIGDDEFVEKELDDMADDIEKAMAMVGQSPDSQEAFTLLTTCLTECRVTHLVRVLLLWQVEGLLDRMQTALRRCLEILLDLESAPKDNDDDGRITQTLSDRQWRLAQLSAGFGGVRLKTGQVTAGATRAMTLLKTEKEVKKFLRDGGDTYSTRDQMKLETTEWCKWM